MYSAVKATSNRRHQGTLQPLHQGCKQPHPHESGFFIQLQPFLTFLLKPMDAHSHWEECSSPWEPPNLCERPRKEQKNAAEGSHCKNQPPCLPGAGWDYRQYLPYFSKGSDISFPRQAHDGCHALRLHWVCDDVISEKESKTGFSLRRFSCLGVF